MCSTILPNLSPGKAGCQPPGMQGPSLAHTAQGQFCLTQVPSAQAPKQA